MSCIKGYPILEDFSWIATYALISKEISGMYFIFYVL